jgi:hypothetical protein
MTVRGTISFSQRTIKNARLVLLGLDIHQLVQNESLYQTYRRTLLTLERTERRQEEYAPHERDMAVQNAKSTSVNLVHVGKSILKQNLLKGTRGREKKHR